VIFNVVSVLNSALIPGVYQVFSWYIPRDFNISLEFIEFNLFFAWNVVAQSDYVEKI